MPREGAAKGVRIRKSAMGGDLLRRLVATSSRRLAALTRASSTQVAGDPDLAVLWSYQTVKS